MALLAGSLQPFGPNDTAGGPAAALAPDQLAAVTHRGGAARIIAPAGSGKTRVLTERARLLLRGWRLPSRAVTLVAYNRRAALEMRERTPDVAGLQVRTLNALGLSLLGRDRPVRTIEEREVRSILATLVDLPRRANTDPALAWIEALSVVRLGLQPPREAEARFGGDVDGLAEVFDRYRALLADRGVCDYDEQIYGALEVLLRDPAARLAARRSCRMLLVDEFQDLAPAHLLLVRLLAGPGGDVVAVGDDDQTIYGYAGASPRWLVEYDRFFPGAGEHPLEVNYRCPPSVVQAAGNLLSRNATRVAKAVRPAPGRAPADGELTVRCGGDALALTTARVTELLASGAAALDVAVLTRVNATLAPVQVALGHLGVPVQPAVGPSYLARSGVAAALAWLRLALAPEGRLSGSDLGTAARRPARGMSPKLREWVEERRSLRDLERLAGRCNARDAEKIDGLVADLRLVRSLAGTATAGQVLAAVRDQVGLGRAMQLLETSRRRLESAHSDDLDALVALAALHPEPAGFESWLAGSLGSPGSPEGVVLATVHKVKGQEWPHVVLHEVTAGLLPHRLAEDLEEERRVFHVGLTRASASCTLVAGEPPSPFLAELGAPAPPRLAGAAAPPRQGTPPRPGTTAGPGRPAATRRAGTEPSVATGPAAERAREALRAWRSARAAAEHKPAYVYLHDRTIEALALALPGSIEALARVPGIGPAKLEAYGDELLEAIAGAAAPGSG